MYSLPNRNTAAEKMRKKKRKKNIFEVLLILNCTRNHQLKLMDSKWRFSVTPEEQMRATSCLISFGPQTRTPILDPLHFDIIPIKHNHHPLSKSMAIYIARNEIVHQKNRRSNMASLHWSTFVKCANFTLTNVSLPCNNFKVLLSLTEITLQTEVLVT